MATITAAMVNELRAKTGQGMMECKKMLTEVGGDIQKAIDEFRKKGVKTSIAERAATEGRVLVGTSADAKTAAVVEINCNTDFTAKSDTVEEVLKLGVNKLLSGTKDLSNDEEFKSAITAAAQKTGENVVLGKGIAVTGPAAASYLYSTAGKGKVGVLMSFAGPVSEDVVKNVGMHIVASRPVSLTREGVPADLVSKEREIAIEQAKATGKPQQIAEKIADGKMNSFFAERVLLDQEFVNGEVFKGKVGDYLKQSKAELKDYKRIEVGQA